MFNGRTNTLKINKRLFASLQLDVFDTIYVDTIEEKPKTKLVDGNWVASSEKEKWLSKCNIIHKYQGY